MLHGQKVVVVMPAYNAALTLRQTALTLHRHMKGDRARYRGRDHLVDDASRDDTAAIARTLERVRVEVPAAGIRRRYTYSNAKGTEPYLGIHWKSAEQTDFSEDAYSKYSPTGDRANWRRGTWSRRNDPVSTVYVWIAQPVQAVRISLPLEQGTLSIRDLTLLVPNPKS
jgi:glycosyltransferase involved in cell wall biosynthesis